MVATSQGSLSSPSPVAQSSAGPHPSTSLVSEPISQPFDKGVTTTAKSAVSDHISTSAPANANPSSSDTTQAIQGSIPLVRRVKVMIDAAYVDTHSNWISEVMRTIGEVSRIYRLEFGIVFDLIGVVCWSDVFPYMSDSELLFNLYNHPTEGADIVLGFVNRPVAAKVFDKGPSEIQTQSRHVFGLVGTNEYFESIFLLSALRSLGTIFGAQQVIDTSTEAYRLGSWMSRATVRSDHSLWIDLPNKHRILEHKARFAMAGNINAP
jgi:hypothetical protein